jgi:hypothetical protein
MGKGTIISHTGDGLYSVTLNLDRTHVTAELAMIEIALPALADMIINKEKEIVKANEEAAELNATMNSYNPGSDNWNKANSAYQAKLTERNKKQEGKDLLTLKRKAYEKRKKYLQDNTPVNPTVSAWCADKTTSLSPDDVVGIIEVPGERPVSKNPLTGKLEHVGAVNIQPGYGSNAVYDEDRDGQLQPSIAGLERNVFYNWGMLPGLEKWLPSYRYGTITAINSNKCNITLEAATCNAKDAKGDYMNVNAVTKLTDVPFDYMDCDEEAFTVDDVVLIEFASVKADIKSAKNWTHATVIGFKDHPKYPESGILVTEAYDISWTQKGFVSLDSALEPVLALEPAITYPTASIEEIVHSSVTSDDIMDSHEDPYLFWKEIHGDHIDWTFRMNVHEHINIDETLTIDGNVVKTSAYVMWSEGFRETVITTGLDGEEPVITWEYFYPPYPGSYTPTSGYRTGTEFDMWSLNAGWVDINHYIYTREDLVYSGVGNEGTQKTYLIINGVETLLYENNTATDSGYFFNMNGEILTAFEEYSEGAAVFQDGTDYKYICAIALNSYDPVLVNSPFWEFFDVVVDSIVP